jgi:hypothetical protein
MWQLELSMQKVTEFFVVVSILPFFTSFRQMRIFSFPPNMKYTKENFTEICPALA